MSSTHARLHSRTLALINRALSGLNLPAARLPRKVAAAARMQFEPLEPRVLMSADLLPGLQQPDSISLHSTLDMSALLAPAAVVELPGSPLPGSSGATAASTSPFVTQFDVGSFSSDLQALSPAGSLVYAGGVTGSLDTLGQTNSLSVSVNAGQSVALRFTPTDAASSLQARIEVFDANNQSLGWVQAGQGGEALTLQVAALAGGPLSIHVTSLAGTGAYQVELFLNAQLEGADSSSAATAHDLTGELTALPGGDGSRVSVIGALNGNASPITVNSENFESPLGGQWTLSSSNPNAYFNRIGYSYGSTANNNALYSEGDRYGNSGGVAAAAAVTLPGPTPVGGYNPTLDEAVWQVDLTNRNNLTLDFDSWGYDPVTEALPQGPFTGSQNADGVSVSTDGGQTWYSLISPQAAQDFGPTHYTVNLSAALAANGLSPGADTQIKFQHFDQPFLDALGHVVRGYRYWDNISLSEPGVVSPVQTPSATLTGIVSGTASSLTDGITPAQGSTPDAASSVIWTDGAQAQDNRIDLDLGSSVTLADLQLSVDGNDDYAIDYSNDGLTWSRLINISRKTGEQTFGLDTLSTVAGSADYAASLDFDAVQARYLRVYGTGSADGSYAVSEVRALVASPSYDPADWYRVDLSAGDTISAATRFSQTQTSGSVKLELYNAQGQLLTFGSSTAGADAAIAGFVATQSGSYFLRVAGSVSGEYNLAVSKQAELGSATADTAQDISLAPTVLDSFTSKSGSSSSGATGLIRVAVLSGDTAVVNQLNDSTAFHIQAQLVNGSQIDSAAELAQYDVVIIGDANTQSQFESFASPLRQWVEAGGGLVATGWTVYGAGPSSGTPVPDIDAVVPVQTNTYYSYSYGGVLHISDSSTPITKGVNDFSLPSMYIEYSSLGADPGAQTLATVNGNAVVVAGKPGNGRSVYLGPTYFYNAGAQTANLDRLLEQAVSWAAGDGGHPYVVQAVAGDTLSISATPLGTGSGQPVNTLVPLLELLDANGLLLSSSTTGSLSYTVASSGSYTVRLNASSGAGDVLLRVAGATGSLSGGFSVARSSIDSLTGGTTTPPTFVDLSFTQPLLLTGLQASDLQINGVAAGSYELISPTQVRFYVDNAVVADGNYTLTLAAGALTDIHGQPVDAWSHSFKLDTTLPVVTASSLAQGEVQDGTAKTVTFTFSEDLSTDYLDSYDVVLTDTLTGQRFYPSSFFYNSANRTLELGLPELPEGSYTLTLASGYYGFKDMLGLPLNGSPSFPLPSGQGDNTGDDFHLNFVVDKPGTQALTNLPALQPLGSLVHAAPVNGSLNGSNDTDNFTVAIDGDQLLSVAVAQTANTPNLQIRLSVYDAQDALVASVDGSAGAGVVLQTLRNASGQLLPAGTYHIAISNLAGEGNYSLLVTLDSAIEDEALGTSFTNDSIGSAQDISSSFVDLGQGGSRGAVAGLLVIGSNSGGGGGGYGGYGGYAAAASLVTTQSTLTPAATVPDTVGDYYSFQLKADEFSTVALDWAQGNTNSGGVLRLDLLDASGTVLATGVAARDGSGQVISEFKPDSAGTYYLRVSGSGEGLYNLAVTRALSFSTQLSGSTTTRQDISTTNQVLGHQAAGGNAIRVAVYDAGGGGSITSTLNADVYGNFTATSVSAYQIDTLAELSQYDVVIIGDSASTYQYESFAGALRQWVESGGSVVATGWTIYGAGSATPPIVGDINAIVPVDTSVYYNYNYSGTVNIVDNTHPATSGLSDFAVPGYVEFSSGGVDPGSTTLATLNGQAFAVVGHPGLGRSAYLGAVYYYNNAGTSASLDRLLEQTVTWAAGDHSDNYLISAQAGDTLSIQTSTPGDGPNEPSNNLDTVLELYDAADNLVASNDNGAADGRNALLTYAVTTGGTYRVRVVAAAGSGAYVVNVAGATGGELGSRPSITSVTPTQGQALANPPTELIVQLSEGVRVDSVSADDLKLTSGGTVTGVEVLAGNRLRFLVDIPLADGPVTYELADGAFTDLQGHASQAYSGSFRIDAVGPKVVSSTPDTNASAPFNTWTFTFSEAIDPNSVSVSDIAVFTGPSGQDLRGNIYSTSVTGNTLTVRFYDQTAIGAYTMVLGPNINDLVGNAMDQNANGVRGEAVDDRYSANVTVRAPDLVTTSVTAPAAGVMGSSITVNWTVRNTGTDTARSSYWYDRILLSTDPTFSNDDRILNYNVYHDNSATLAPDGSYTGTATVTLPIDVNFTAGTYYVLVQADIYGYQFESNESNNIAASNTVAVTVPPLPDLTVDNIVAPLAVEGGKPVTITWTDHNIGNQVTSSGWYDQVYLSSDPTYSSDDYALTTLWSNTASLAAGGSLDRSATVTVPASSTGNWYVIVRTDIYNYVQEYVNENNNTGVSATRMNVVVPTEDLVPTAITAPTSANFGQTVNVQWTIQNAGTGPTLNNWSDRIWLSKDATLSNDDIFIRDYSSAGNTPLAVGASYDRSVDLTLPLNANLTAGTYYLLVQADSSNSEPETNENNNVRASGAVTLSVPPYADLTVSNITTPAGARAGDTVPLHFTLTNQGTAAASNFAYRVSLTNQAGTSTQYLGDFYFNDTLNAGQSVDITQNITPPISAPGDWYVNVYADIYNTVYEHTAENNNSARGSLTSFPQPPLADLVVTDISAPQDALAGQVVPITWTIKNQGTLDIVGGSWVDRIYLSTDGGTSNNIYIGDFTFEGSLAAGASVTRTQNITLPATQIGDYKVVIYTDTYGQYYETAAGENNNRTADDTTLHVTFPPLPNLRVTSITPPSDAFSSTQSVVSWVVTNSGTGSTSSPNWVDDVYLSLNSTFGDGDDIYLGQVNNPSYLAAGESYVNSLTFTVPQGLAGDYHFLVRTDAYNNVFENQSEGDNITVSAFTHFTLTPPPDLQVTSVQTPSQAFSGQPMNLNWTVTNAGDGRTLQTSWYDRIFISNDNVFDGGDIELDRVWHDGALNAGGSYTSSRTVNLPVGVVGPHYFFVVTDAFNNVYEHVNENNNSGFDSRATNIVLTPPPDLEVDSLTTPSTARAGDPLSFQYRVTNFGSTATAESYWTDSFYLSTDKTLSANDLLLGTQGHGGVLGVDASYGGNVSFTLPNTLSGSYYLIVHTDSGNQVFEGFAGADGDPNANNITASASPITIANTPADLVIDSFNSPATGEAGKPIVVSWTVRNAGTGSTQAANWVDQIVVSANSIVGDGDDVVIGTVTHDDAVQAGSSYTGNAVVTLPFSLQGSYKLFVRTDAYNSVYEGSNEGNNSSANALSVTRQTPDLHVSSVTPPATDVIGGPLTVSWHVDNQGANRTDSTYWYDDVWLSADATLGSGDIYLGNYYRSSPLNAGQGYDASASFNLPANLVAGSYYVITRTDAYGYVTEGAGETNNVTASANKVYVATKVLQPDLQVEAVDAPATAISGQALDLTWTVRNKGVDPTGNRSWYDAVYLSRDLVFDRATDIYLGYADHSGDLAAGASYTQTRSFNVPLGQSGPFYVFVVTDSGNAVLESVEGNNAGYDSGFTQVSLAPPADLVVGDITIPVNGIPGQNATLTYSVNNQGSNAALGAWRDSIYLSTDDKWDIGDQLFGTVQHNGNVAGGSSYTEHLTAALPGLTPGSYHVIVRSDILNNIAESNENNNVSASLDSVALDVQALTLGTPVSGTVGLGQSVFYKIVVGAGETVRVSLDGAGADDGNELYLRYGSMPTRGQFDETGRDPFLPDQQTVIPTSQAGTYYVMVYGASGSASHGYTLTAQVLPFSVQSADLHTISDAGPATLQIDGAKFDANTSFELVNAAGDIIFADATQLENSSRAYVTFDARSRSLGDYTLRAVENAGAANAVTATLTGSIKVVSGTGDNIVRTFDGPAQVRPGRIILANIDYTNNGDADAMAPLFIITSSTGTAFGSTVESIGLSDSVQLLGVASSGPQDILRPGDKNSLPILFKAVNAAMSFSARTISSNSLEAIDFDLVERSIRNPSLSTADWNARWLTQIKPRLGNTWGDYVRLINDLSKEFSTPDHVISDVRELFNRAFTDKPGFLASAAYSGTLLDATTNSPMAGVQVAAFRQSASGGLTLAATTVTDANGAFSLRYLRPGTYVLALAQAAVNADGNTELQSSFIFDMNKNGVEDAASPSFVVTDTADISGVQIFAATKVAQPVPEFKDNTQALAVDAAGRTHMVWMRDGQLWHAVNEGTGWQNAAQLPAGAAGSNIQLVADPKLIDGSREGLLATWRQGNGNDAEIYYAVGERLSNGSYHWSAPTKLTDNSKFDGAYAVSTDANGNPVFLMQRSDASISDDTDIYGKDISISNVQWVQSVQADMQALEDWLSTKSDAELEALGIFRYRWAYKLDKSFPVIGNLGGEARLDLQGQLGCSVVLSGNGALKFNIGSFEIEGRVGGDVRFQANKDTCSYEFKSARITLSASGAGNFSLTALPIPSLTPLFYLLDSLGIKGRGEAAVGANFIWYAGSDFPGWPSQVTGSLRGSIGLNWEGDIPWVGKGTLRLLVNFNGKIDQNGLGLGDPPVSISALARIKYPWGFREITYTFNPGDLLPTSLDGNLLSIDQLLTQSSSGNIAVTYGLNTDTNTGTLNDYTGTGETRQTNNLTDEGEPVIAKDPSGTLWGAWTSADGIAVTSRSGSTWSASTVIPGSGGYVNSNLALAFDGNGNGLAVWDRLDTSSLGASATSAQIQALIDAGGDLVFARYDAATGTWSTPQVLATRSGDEQFVSLQRLANGDVLAAWVGLSDTPNSTQGQSILSARWSASSATWSTVTEVAYESIAGDVRISSLAGQPLLVWSENLGNGSVLRTASWNGSGWSQPSTVTISLSSSLVDTANALLGTQGSASTGASAGTTASDTGLELAGLDIGSPPEDCCKDKKPDPPYTPKPVVPRDPNDITGPDGFGDAKWIPASATLPYTIRFENAADAAAPAQEVVITQQLDADLDWRTFRVDDFGFGDQRVQLDAKNAFYQARLDLTATKGYLLDVSASIDVSTGIVTWRFTTIDPATGEIPTNAQLGFLPPNKDADGNKDGRGEGFVSYTVKAKRTAATGDVIDAKARIVFDTEEPIDTPPIFNTLDAGVPTSSVTALAAQTDTPTFQVSWTGSDGDSGSALRDYTIWVSDNGAQWRAWLLNTTDTESLYEGERGHHYAFYSVARDNAGNVETIPATADASTTVSPGQGSVSGTVFDDVDGNGVQGANEAGLSGWTVFLDANANGVLDSGERSTVTDATGGYSLDAINAGSVTIGRVLQTGWVSTAPADNRQVVTITADTLTTGANFGSFQLGSISGVKFDDANGNGVRDAGEAGLAGWIIQLDRNADGSIDASTVTADDGSYSFSGLAAGTYRVTEVGQAGWLQTAPAAGSYSVSISSGTASTARNFADVRAASISGTQFDDLNGNGLRDAGEAALSGWTIFLDSNANGVLDSGERSTVSGADGSYRFDNLLPGSYTVAEVLKAGWLQTAPGTSAGSTAAHKLDLTGIDQVLELPEAALETAAAQVSGSAGNAWANTLTGLDAFRADSRFAGINGQGESVVVIDTGIDLNHPFFGVDANGDGVDDRIVYQYDFANGDSDASDHSGHGSNVASIIGSSDATYGGVAPDVNLISLKVFDDNGKGYFSYLEKALQWVVDHADDYHVSVVNLSLGDGGNWNTTLGRYGLDDELAALAAKNIIVTAAAGNNYAQYGGAWGVAYPAADPAVLAVGATWVGDLGGPWNFSTGATDYTTGADRIASFSQRDDHLLDVFAPGARLTGANATGGTVGMQGTSQASAYMAGVAALAQDLALNTLGRRLSLSEFTHLLNTTSAHIVDGDDENDNVRNSGLTFNRVNVEALAEAILALPAGGDNTGNTGSTGGSGSGGSTGGSGSNPGTTQPAAGPAVHSVTVTAGQAATGLDFGNFKLASISGSVLHDLNANGSIEAGETGLGGFTVFLDTNHNGVADVGETSTVTGADGSFSFTDLGPGSRDVVVAAREGWKILNGSSTVTLSSGQSATATLTANALPTLDAIAGQTVAEGSKLTVTLAGHDTAGDSLSYSLVDGPSGASVDASTGVFTWTPADGAATQTVSVRVTDRAGSVAERNFNIDVSNVAPTLSLTGAAAVEEEQPYTLNLSANDPGTDTISQWLINWGDGVVQTVAGNPGSVVHTYADPGSYAISATATDEDGSYAVNGPQVQVTTGRGAISGLLFDDRNGDGLRQADEAGLAGFTVFVDSNSNGNLDAGELYTVTGNSGAYLLNGITAGSVSIVSQLPVGWIATAAVGNSQTVNVVTNQTVNAADFAAFKLGRIDGLVYHDENADGSHAASETGTGLAGFSVLLDANSNGVADAGEQTTTTDADGHFSFNGLRAGNYQVVLSANTGWKLVTSLAGAAISSGSVLTPELSVNALPTLDALGNASVNEGSVLSLNLGAGHDSAGDSLSYSLVAGPAGASIDAQTGVFNWTPADGPLSQTVTVRATDRAGSVAERSFTIQVNNVAPTLSLTGAANVEEGQPYTLNLSANDPGTDTISLWVINWGDGITQTVTGNPGSVAHSYAAAGSYAISATATDEDGSYAANGPSVNVTPSSLQVASFNATHTGFKVRFNRAIDASQLNLYDSASFNLGTSDVSFTTAAGQPVVGSLVVDADARGITFIKTGGTLAAGSYNVRLNSGAHAFTTPDGKLLDGNGDKVGGDAYSTSFTATAGGAVLAIGEIARGPGQAINVAATGDGLPITLANAAGATRVAFTLTYNAALMSVTGVLNGTGLPAGSTLSADLSVPGQVRVVITAGSALGAGVLELVRLQASVPATAAYGAKQVLDLGDINVTTASGSAINVRDDDGLHVVAYIGDTSGNAAYSTLDVQRIQRVLVRADSGFGAWPLVDPTVIGDVNGSGTLSSLDATRLQQKLTGVSRPEIPDIPTGIGPLTFAGADPVLSLPTVSGAPGSVVSVPVNIDTAAGLENFELVIAYPADQLELVDAKLAGIAADFQYLVKDTSVPGRVRIDASRLQALAGGSGQILELQLRIKPRASGSLAIDLQWATLNDTRLTLNPAPQPGADPTDGAVQVTPPAQVKLHGSFSDFKLGSASDEPQWLKDWLHGKGTSGSAGSGSNSGSAKTKAKGASLLKITPHAR